MHWCSVITSLRCKRARAHLSRVVAVRADVADVTGARKEEVPRVLVPPVVLVERERHHPIAVDERLLDAIAVVDIDVNVQHPRVVLEQL